MHSNNSDKGDKGEKGQAGRMRIGELARAAGVRRETVHFYLREGLLPPPEKVNARVAYFDEGHLARIRIIKALQQAHLPLSEIQKHLEGLGALSEKLLVQRGLQVIAQFFSVGGDDAELTPREVAESAGLTAEQLSQLEQLGVVEPQLVEGRPLYTRADTEAAAAARTIMDQGVRIDALSFVREYVRLAKLEMNFLLRHVIQPAMAAGRRDQVSATAAVQALWIIEAYLRRQLRRRQGLFPASVQEYSDLPDGGQSSGGIGDVARDVPPRSVRKKGKSNERSREGK